MNTKIRATGLQLAQTVDGEILLTLKIHKTSNNIVKLLYEHLKLFPLLDVLITKHRKKRSLDANAYAWVLLDQLSEVLKIPPEEIYKSMIRNIGGNSYIVPVKKEAVKSFQECWSKNGIGWVTETIGESKIQGYENIKLYKGSSVYTTDQMSRLIHLIIQECEQQGIPTKTTVELDRLIEGWEKKNG